MARRRPGVGWAWVEPEPNTGGDAWEVVDHCRSIAGDGGEVVDHLPGSDGDAWEVVNHLRCTADDTASDQASGAGRGARLATGIKFVASSKASNDAVRPAFDLKSIVP